MIEQGPLTRIVQKFLRELADELQRTGETIEARDDILVAAAQLREASRVLRRIISPLRPLRKLWSMRKA